MRALALFTATAGVVALVLLLLMLGGRMQRLSQRIADLEGRGEGVAPSSAEPDRAPRAASDAPRAASGARAPEWPELSAPVTPPPDATATSAPVSVAPGEPSGVTFRALSRLVAPDAAGRYALVDRSAARDMLGALRSRQPADDLDVDTLNSAALAALLLDALDAAGALERAALRRGLVLTGYYKELGWRLLDVGQTDQARAVAARLVAFAPAQAPALLLQAAVKRAESPPDIRGVEDLCASIGLEPLAPWELVRLAHLLVDLQEWQRLGALLTLLSDAAPDLHDAREFLTAVYELHSDLPQSAAMRLDRLLERHGDHPAWLTWRGAAALKAGDLPHADALLARVAPDSDLPQAHCWRGLAAWSSGDLEAAKAHLQRATAAGAWFVPAWEALAALSLDQGDATEAVAALTRAVALRPRRAESHLMLAIAHAKTGDAQASAAALRAALSLRPELLSRARQAEVLNQLFAPPRMEEMMPAAP